MPNPCRRSPPFGHYVILAALLLSTTRCGDSNEAGDTVEVPSLSKPIPLFDGTGLDSWISKDGKNPAHWSIESGSMIDRSGSGPIRTKETHGNARIHLEFQLPEDVPGLFTDSGIELQGRYEIQISNDKDGKEGYYGCGAICHQKAAPLGVRRDSMEWQSLDIEFYAARFNGDEKIEPATITVWMNDTLIHDGFVLLEGTGGRKEGPEPGPLILQSSPNPIAFRNISLLPLSRDAITVRVSEPSTKLSPGLIAHFIDQGGREVWMKKDHARFALQKGEAPHPSLDPMSRASLQGWVHISRSGHYRFRSQGALTIAGREVDHRPLRLTPGTYPFAWSTRRLSDPWHDQVRWESEHFDWEPIPRSALFHDEHQALQSKDQALADSGRSLTEDYGCIACHQVKSETMSPRQGPRLGGVGSRLKGPWIAKWLTDPQSFRESAVMPSLLYRTEDIQDVTAYLMSLQATDLPPAVEAPEDKALLGEELYKQVGCLACHSSNGMELKGIGSKWDVSALADYLYHPSKYDPSGRMPALLNSEEEAEFIASYLVQSTDSRFESPLDRGDFSRGKSVFESAGCLSCHEIGDEKSALPSPQPLVKLTYMDRGCLSETRQEGIPHYSIGNEQRDAIVSFVDHFQRHPDQSLSPAFHVKRRIEQLDCAACHSYGDDGPIVLLGDTPPPLTDVGSKLKSSWLREVLLDNLRIRPWYQLRMPRFDSVWIEPFIEGLAADAGVLVGEGQMGRRGDQHWIDKGQGIVGTSSSEGGLACITCHDFRGREALSERGPDMTAMGRRLRHDWFVRWMRSPGRIQGGTSMPEFFPLATSASAHHDIASLWAYLEKGSDMGDPPGLSIMNRIETDPLGHNRPKDRAIITRTFMPDSGPASIAVALPVRDAQQPAQSYCWDTANCRLRYAWKGPFLDNQAHLAGNGNAFSEVMGRIYFRSYQSPWIIDGLQSSSPPSFVGYRIEEGIPTFEYSIGKVHFRDRFQALEEGNGLERSLHIKGDFETIEFETSHQLGTDITSNVGQESKRGWLYSKADAKELTLTYREIVGHEPEGYWSLDNAEWPHWNNSNRPREGRVGRSLNFDGKKHDIPTTLPATLIHDEMTLGAWVEVSEEALNDDQDHCILGAKEDDDHWWALRFRSHTRTFDWSWSHPDQKISLSSSPIEGPGWYSVFAISSPDSLTLMIGDRRTTLPLTSSPSEAPRAELRIGSLGKTQFWRGRLDEIRVYDRLLSEDELSFLRNLGEDD